MRLFLAFSILCATCALSAQQMPALLNDALYWRNIGPANQGGRIVDIEALESDYTEVWVATGSGGVWHSDNAGTTWTPIFDNYSTASIGDIAVFQDDPSIIWVGTGEANNRNSVSWGNGIYKSTDGGQSFVNLGLNNTHQIARVVTYPGRPEEVCVCAIGHLWGHSGERGLFHTTDGGETWTKLTDGLPDDGKTGCTDLVRDPEDPDILYSAFYERLRKPWHFESGGENGGIFKSTDGGRSWNKLTNGLPSGPTGRIGLAVYRSNPDIVMALVEAEQTDTLSIPGSGVYRSEDAGATWTYINTYNNRPFYYSQIRINPLDDKRVYLLTTRFMVSEDGGASFANGSRDQEVHGDFHAMWLDPQHSDRYYLGADKGVSLTHDHGNGFQLFDNLPIAQYYRIGVDHRDPYYVYGGLQDNGFYATASFARDVRGILNDHNWKVHWGDGMYTESDPDNWRLLYTSSENGSINRYDPVTHRIERISPRVANIRRLREYYTTEELGKPGLLRFNWEAPMQLALPSKNLYVAGNHLFKSTDRGESWTVISPDLTTNDPEKTRYRASGGITPDNSGAETHCTATTLAVSPLDENTIWVGTDDGLVHITRDGGLTWTDLTESIPGVPPGIWVSRIEVSNFKPGTAYVAFDGHRSDHNAPYLFSTEDYGAHWTMLGSGLYDDEVIRVVREDPFNENLLYIGTETGVWASVNKGSSWFRLMENMPTVSVYDLLVHPRDRDLIAGTHGRSLWIMDNVAILEQMDEDVLQEPFYLFEQPEITLWENVSRGGQRGHFLFAGDNPEEIRPTSSLPRARFEVDAIIYYYINPETDTSDVEIRISDGAGNAFTEKLHPLPGLNKVRWDRTFDLKPLTDQELTIANISLSSMAERLPTENIVEALEDFESADDDQERREIIQYIIDLDIDDSMDPSMGLLKAGPGEYKITLRVGRRIHNGTLVIREDPILTSEIGHAHR